MQNRKLLLFRAATIALALFATSFCYLYGAWQKVEGSSYTGIRPLNVYDFNQNLSWIEQCRGGNFFLKNLFTSEPQEPYLVRPLYYLLSLPFRSSSLSHAAVFHIGRILVGFILLLALYSLLKVFEPDRKLRDVAFALLVFTSGIGALIEAWIPNPADMKIPESVLFLSLGESPHFGYSLLLLWIGVASIFLATEKKSYGTPVFLLCIFLLLWDHPFDAVTLAILGLLSFWRLATVRQRIVAMIGLGAVLLPGYLYYRKLLTMPAYAGWASEQNLMSSPSVASLLSPFVPLIFLGFLGGSELWKNTARRKTLQFLVVWILVQFALAYAPLPFQRRLVSGVQFPLAILSAYSLRKLKTIWIAAIILLCSYTNIFFSWQMVLDLQEKSMPYYLPNAYQNAFRWLASRVDDGAVLNNFMVGNFIPAYTSHPTYMGHPMLTPNLLQRRQFAQQFFADPKLEFLNANHIRYVFYGFEERHLSRKLSEFHLRRIYDKEGVTLFTLEADVKMHGYFKRKTIEAGSLQTISHSFDSDMRFAIASVGATMTH